MGLSMQERKVVTKALAEQYRRGRKKEKGRLLTEFVRATGHNRSYASWLLRNHGRRVEMKPGVIIEGRVMRRPRQERARTYGPEVFPPLKKVWEIMDCISGKRLSAAMPEVVPRLVQCRELKASKKVQRLLLSMSAATIDRMLKTEREKHTLKGRAHTKPGSLLKHQIPIRTFADWDEAKPGFLEMDLVAHDGGVACGDYCFTLDMTDVATGWSVQRAVMNKAQTHVFSGIQALRHHLPFPLLGLDSDNGSEFINHHLKGYCDDEHITFTRSRPYRKNDTCYVEQKNWSIVRRQVGYARYQGEGPCELLNTLYALLADYVNFFMPSMKLKEKTRDGARVTRRHDAPATPYVRVLRHTDIAPAVKRRLRTRYEGLNPAQLKRDIERVQRQLVKNAARLSAEQAAYLVREAAQRAASPGHPWRGRAVVAGA